MASESVTASSNAPSKLHQYSAKGRRGRKTSLERIPEMPLDVVFEIFSHLTPLDLLYLGRSSKTLRGLIFSKRSSFLWRAARGQVEGLPPKPSFLSEPQYANLAFDHHCHCCPKSNVKSVIWIFLARYCNECKSRMTIRDQITEFFPPITHSQPNSISRNPLPFILLRSGARSRGLVESWFHKPEVDELRRVLQEADNAEQKLKLINDRQELTSEIKKFGELCQKWVDNTKTARLRDLAAVKQRRYDAIIDRLTALGWGKDIEYLKNGLSLRSLRNHRLVKQPKDLTDRAWAKICPTILIVMEDIKSKHLIALRTKAIHKRLGLLKTFMATYRQEGIFKGVGGLNNATLAGLPEVREVIDVSADVELTLGDLHHQLRPRIPKLVACWRMKIEAHLAEAVSVQVRVPKDISPLDLAIAVFKCTACSKCQRYPDLLDHDCHQMFPPILGSDSDPDSVYTREVRMVLGLPRLDILHNLQPCLIPVIEMMGKDPNRTTATDMDELGVNLICWAEQCLRLVTWRDAMTHLDHSLSLRPEGSAQDAAEVERSRRYKFRCLHCHTLWSSGTDVVSHLRSSHNKFYVIEHKDFYPGYSPIAVKAIDEASGLPFEDHLAMMRRQMTLDLSFEDHLAMMELPFAEQYAYLG